MGEQETKGVRAGYRTTVVLLALGLTSIGFTRFEDRAIIGAPGSPASAMVALAQPPASVDDETYSGEPDNSVSLSDASRVPANRIRRVLRDRDVANAAARQILAPGPIVPGAAAPLADPGAAPAANNALAPVPTTLANFAPSGPPLPGQGAPLFAANLPSNDGGGGAGAGGGGGTGGGAGGGTPAPTPTPTPTPTPVSPVPEPGTWLMLVMGLFAVGGALRARGQTEQLRAVKRVG